MAPELTRHCKLQGHYFIASRVVENKMKYVFKKGLNEFLMTKNGYLSYEFYRKKLPSVVITYLQSNRYWHSSLYVIQSQYPKYKRTKITIFAYSALFITNSHLPLVWKESIEC